MYGLNMVSWKDYEGVEGFGTATQVDVDELNKALTAGQAINPPGAAVAGDGFALRVESLERTLKNTLYRMEHLRLFKAIPKIAAYNTVEEFNQLLGYGENQDAGFIDEGALPEEDDSTYERKVAIVKYLGTTRRCTHVASLIRPAHGNVVAQETINGTMHLLKILERALFFARSDLSALQFDGFEKLLKDNSPVTNIIDQRGDPLSEDILTDAALTMQDAPNYGTPTHLHLTPKVKADLCKTFFPKERHGTFDGKGGLVGLDIKGFTSPAGDVAFEPNVFITDGGAPNAAAVGKSDRRPGTPVVSTAYSTPVATTPPSQFGADDAGDYFYWVTACNRYGRSIAVNCGAAGAAVTVAALDETTWAMTPGGATSVEWYEVYRTKVDAAVTTAKLILRVPNTAGAGAQTIHDYNDYLPETTSAFMFQQNLENMSFKQLAPMVKIPLATIDSSIRWMQLLYGVPVIYTPGKNILFTNVGRATGFVGAP